MHLSDTSAGEHLNGEIFLKLLPCIALLVPLLDSQRLVCLLSLGLVVVSVFGNIAHPVTEQDIRIFKETFMEVIRAYDFRITPRAHLLAHRVSEYARLSAVPLGPPS